ncbi:MAG: CPBP family glutamic-type intramembrane protease, partial [Bacteroidia bacterium]|nr:CPBP family glutamic-type intramembrane protease [Bacteroidia bacterium]
EFMKRRVWITILLPAIVFGFLHDFSLQYILIATLMGIVFQYTYHVRSKKGDPFLSTFLLHALLNGIAITMQLFL